MEALDQVSRTKPDLVILDVTMPRMSGAEAARQIRALWPSVKILIFSMHRPELLMGVPSDGIVYKGDAALKLTEVIDNLLRENETDDTEDTATKRPKFKAKSDKRPKLHSQ
jgi:DNA-binding NarL/FixJ family response regulator